MRKKKKKIARKTLGVFNNRNIYKKAPLVQINIENKCS